MSQSSRNSERDSLHHQTASNIGHHTGSFDSGGAEIYAIPITSIQESHRIKMTDIDMLDNNEVINIRDDVTSLLRLDQLFRIQSEGESEYGYVVVVGSGENKVGLMSTRFSGRKMW